MNYSELIEKYKNGELDEALTSEVSNDIDRHEAISEYLAEREDIPELGELFDEEKSEGPDPAEESKAFTKKVKKQIRRAFLKAGLITAALVLGIVFFCMYALPKIIENSYYDPTERVGGSVKDDNGDIYEVPSNRLSIDISVYSELFLPGNFRQRAEASSLGYGNYSVNIHQNFSRTGVFRDTAGVIQKGKLTLYDPNLLKLPVANIFESKLIGVAFQTDEKQQLEEVTYGMQPGEQRYVYVSFDEPIPYAQAVEWCKNNEVDAEWCAVCTGNEVKTNVYYGARLTTNSVIQGYPEDDYPYLSVYSVGLETSGFRYPPEDIMKQHLISLLSYCADNPKGMSLFYSSGDIDDLLQGCRESAEYIKEYGFSVYGVMFYGDVEQIESVFGLDGVSYMYTENVG